MQIYEVSGGCVRVRFAVMGVIENNVYALDDGAGGIVVVDPSRADGARALVEACGCPVSGIIATHYHWDHTGGLAALHEATGAPVYASAQDAAVIEPGQQAAGHLMRAVDACPVAHKLLDGDTFQVGALTFRAIATPGHTPGSMCFLLEEGPQPGAPILVSGDTLFARAHGRTDFVDGSPADMAASLRRLAQFADETLVLPGHNELTTIGDERAFALAE